jgi:hypothetical protein
MSTHAPSTEIARVRGISQRHARRMIANNDPRLQPIDRPWLQTCSRRRQAEVVICQALVISDALRALDHISDSEAYNSGPELDTLSKLIGNIRRQVIALEGVGHDLQPKDEA